MYTSRCKHDVDTVAMQLSAVIKRSIKVFIRCSQGVNKVDLRSCTVMYGHVRLLCGLWGFCGVGTRLCEVAIRSCGTAILSAVLNGYAR